MKESYIEIGYSKRKSKRREWGKERRGGGGKRGVLELPLVKFFIHEEFHHAFHTGARGILGFEIFDTRSDFGRDGRGSFCSGGGGRCGCCR